MTVEWQIAEGSRTAHLIDTEKSPPSPLGPHRDRAATPQRNMEFPWFGLPAAADGVKRAIATYHCRTCDDCDDLLPGGR